MTKKTDQRMTLMTKKTDVVADEPVVAVTDAEKIAILHERVKTLELAKGWHDAELCKVFE